MKTLKNMLLTIAMLLCCIAVSAQRFEVDGIYYSILSTEDKTIKVSGHNNETCQDCVSIPETIENNGVVYTVTSIGDEAFLECEYLSSITIPSSVRVIGNYAFDYCPKLTSVTIPNSVTSIGDGAFRHSNLTSVNIPNSVTYIGQQAFYDTAWWNSQGDGLVCKDSWLLGYKGNLSGEIVISKEVTRIASYAFYLCSGLTKVEIPSSVTSIGQHAFDQCSNLTEIEIPNSITSIEDYTFYNCTRLTSVTIPNSVTSIGGCAFYCCSGLTSVTIPNSVTSIDCDAFTYCSGLTSVIIPNSVTNIESSAFSYCSGLVSVTIPNSVTSIGGWAFYSCTALKDVYCYAENVPSTDAAAFNSSNYSKATLYVPAGSLESYKTTSPWSGFGNIVALSPFSGEAEIDGINYELNGETKQATVIAKSSGSYSDEVVIPESVEHEGTTYSVTSIGESAFRDCKGLTSVTIPNSVTSIGTSAFSGCTSLFNITIPSGISKIENYTFEDCISLTRITIPDNITEIGEYAFRGCRKINKLLIGNSVNSIQTNAFEYCSGLTLLVLPKSLRWVSSNAFHGCTNLKTVINFSYETPKRGEIDCGYAGYYAERIANRSDGNMYLDGDFVFNRTNSGNELLAYLGSDSDITLPDWSNNGDESYSISGGIFKNDKTVISITVPKSVIEIGSEAFYGTGWWNNQEDGLLYLDSWIIGYKGQSPKGEIIINEGTTGIANYAFEWCGITSVKIPNSVINIGYGAFYYCKSLSSITCLNPISPTCGNNAFYNVSTSSCQLLVPASAIEAYTTTSPWSTFTNIEALPLTDGEDFENTEEQELKTITYTRTLPNLYWNALYVPFEIPVSEIIDKYEVAYVNNVNSYDHNDDGTIDDMRMEVIKIKSGTLNANYPYLIKARNEEAKNMTITLENTTLFQSVETTIDCSSVFAKHEITGIYNKRYKNELPEGAMAISMAGAWQPIASGSYLNPFRLYMTITARDGSPVKVEPAAMSRIRISVLGEDVETDIEETRSETKNIILDLSGRSVQNPAKGGVYIVNGKKVIF